MCMCGGGRQKVGVSNRFVFPHLYTCKHIGNTSCSSGSEHTFFWSHPDSGFHKEGSSMFWQPEYSRNRRDDLAVYHIQAKN